MIFEIEILVQDFKKDKDKKPAKTTSNAIEAGTFAETIMVANDAVLENDSMKFVYVGKENPVKQIVWLGDENENNVLIKKGLKEDDVVWLTEPANAAELKISGIEIYEEIKKEKENVRILAEKEREELFKEKPDPMPVGGPGKMMPGAIRIK